MYQGFAGSKVLKTIEKTTGKSKVGLTESGQVVVYGAGEWQLNETVSSVTTDLQQLRDLLNRHFDMDQRSRAGLKNLQLLHSIQAISDWLNQISHPGLVERQASLVPQPKPQAQVPDSILYASHATPKARPRGRKRTYSRRNRWQPRTVAGLVLAAILVWGATYGWIRSGGYRSPFHSSGHTASNENPPVSTVSPASANASTSDVANTTVNSVSNATTNTNATAPSLPIPAHQQMVQGGTVNFVASDGTIVALPLYGITANYGFSCSPSITPPNPLPDIPFTITQGQAHELAAFWVNEGDGSRGYLFIGPRGWIATDAAIGADGSEVFHLQSTTDHPYESMSLSDA